jgi:hypothetical protein
MRRERELGAPLRLSIVSPRCRAASPKPPPSVTPATPTDGHDPPGTVTPDLAKRA